MKQPYDQKSDLWSLGVIVYRFVYGRYPYEVDTTSELRTSPFSLSPFLQ